MFYIVEAVVDKEAQFGNDAHLIVNAGAQLIAYGFHILAHIFEQLVTLFTRENAQIGRANTQIGTYFRPRNAFETTLKSYFVLSLAYRFIV